MNILEKESVNKIWKAHNRFINKFAIWIVLFFILISGVALYFGMQHIGVNSHTADMFDPSLPFRQQQDKFNENFPITNQNFVIVIDAVNPETADSISSELAGLLNKNPALYEDVYIPGGEDFFKKNQFLFLKKDQLEDLTDKLSRSYVLYSLLAQNYSLRGLLLFVDQVFSMGNEEQISKLDRLIGQIEYTIRAKLEGTDHVLSWQSVMTPEDLNRNQNLRFIQVKPVLDYNRLIPAKPAIDRVREIIKKYDGKNNTTVSITGSLAMSYEELQSILSGTTIAGILALITVGLILWIGLRSFRLIFCALLTLLAGLSLTTAFSAWAVGELNMISVAFAVLYIGLGIDYAIHFILKFNELVLKGVSGFDALKGSFKKLSGALFLSTFSTAFGFYAFIPTSFDGVSELGIIAGTGMFISLVATFTLLPALLSLLYKPGMNIPPLLSSAPWGEQISHFQKKYTTHFRAATFVIGLASLFLLPKIGFDYNPINLRDDQSESVATINKLMQSGSFTPWTIEIMAADSHSAKEHIHKLRNLDMVDQALSVFNFIPNNQQEKLSLITPLRSRYQNIPPVKKDSASYYPENQIEAINELQTSINKTDINKSDHIKELSVTLEKLEKALNSAEINSKQTLIEQLESNLLQTFPRTLQNLKQAMNAEPVSMDNLPEYITDRWISDRGIYRIQVTPSKEYGLNNERLRTFASAVTDLIPDATGSLITVINSGDNVVKAFKEAMIYAFIIITILLIIYLRSIKYTLYVLLPLILAGIMTGGAMVLLNLQFNFANIIALPLLLGLGVDNGVHIVHRARDHKTSAGNLLQTSTARAIFFSSLTTLFSFGNLGFSPHTGTASMGLVLTLGLIFTIFTTLIILPAFIIENKNKNPEQV